jgi:hypothetical protein
MISIDTLTLDWTALSSAQQLAHWTSFIDDLDAGAAGFHRFYPVLMPLWDRGDVPGPISEMELARFETEARGEALWELEHPGAADLEPAELPY